MSGSHAHDKSHAHKKSAGALVNPPQKGTAITVSLSQHVITFYKDGKKERVITDFSFGGKKHGKMFPTPTGDFEVESKDKDHVSGKYKTTTGKPAPMPYATFFKGGAAFHQGDTNVHSHGCIHLSKDDAKFIFENSEVHKTKVHVKP